MRKNTLTQSRAGRGAPTARAGHPRARGLACAPPPTRIAMGRLKQQIAVVWSALLLGSLAGCASMPMSQQPPEEVIMERAQARLDTLLAGNTADAYAYLSPGYRSSVSLNAWQRDWFSRRVVWDQATVRSAECEEDACEVDVDLRFSLYNAVPGAARMQRQQRMTEDWVKLDGVWYLVP